jgi:cell wall-associated NlpC family hydrolase
MLRSLLSAVWVALLFACAAEPEPMRTGLGAQQRYHPPNPSAPVANPTNPTMVGDAAWAAEAAKWIGSPYRPGGDSRDGMDALGLVGKMYENVARIELPGKLDELSRTGNAIPRDQLRPGDILFFGELAGVFLGDDRLILAHPTVGVVYAQVTDLVDYRTARRILR